KTVLKQPPFTLLWFAPVSILLGISRALVLTLSFKRIVSQLGHNAGNRPAIPLLSPTQEQRAQQIGQVVRLAAKYAPWQANCFAQAITARLLLGLYGIPYSLYFGLAREGDVSNMSAHAWVAAGRVRVTGGYSFGHYTVVGCFIMPTLRALPQVL
ncbi:MAG: lasso peptide biosynthesis B2 protein, partial [Cyanobacteria bacterium J06632_3]